MFGNNIFLYKKISFQKNILQIILFWFVSLVSATIYRFGETFKTLLSKKHTLFDCISVDIFREFTGGGAGNLRPLGLCGLECSLLPKLYEFNK